MKAVLVLDEMPDNCEECKIIYLQEHGESICNSADWSKRPSRCPLKPLPRKSGFVHPDVDGWCKLSEYSRGYNACLDEITGEDE